MVAANKEERARAAAEAEVLLQEEQLAFEAWRDSLETVPTIKALRGKAEAIRAVELEKTLNKLGDGLTNKQKKVRGPARLDGWKVRTEGYCCARRWCVAPEEGRGTAADVELGCAVGWWGCAVEG